MHSGLAIHGSPIIGGVDGQALVLLATQLHVCALAKVLVFEGN